MCQRRPKIYGLLEESQRRMGRGRMWAERMQGEVRNGMGCMENHKSWGGLGIKHRELGGAHRPPW